MTNSTNPNVYNNVKPKAKLAVRGPKSGQLDQHYFGDKLNSSLGFDFWRIAYFTLDFALYSPLIVTDIVIEGSDDLK